MSNDKASALRRLAPTRLPSPATLQSTAAPDTVPGRVGRAFGDLKIRPKLMVLHNLFFLVLAFAAYFSLIPFFERQVTDARSRELGLIRQIFASDLTLSKLQGLESYDYLVGSAVDLRLDPNLTGWLDAHPGEVWSSPDSSYIYVKGAKSGLYRRLKIAQNFYNDVVQRAQLLLFIVLGAIYVGAVLVLETAIMPLYVYRPLRLMLDADLATQRGDRQNEMIPSGMIPGDEIGQIMRARNAAIAELRTHEDNLGDALHRLEEQDRLASLGLLSASVAHELNTPLTVLHGSIEKLLETTTDPHTLERLGRMERVTQRLRAISETLIDFARRRKPVMEPLDLKPIVDEAWALVTIDEQAAKLAFCNQLEPGTRVTGNSSRLVQVFVNLLRNAAQFTSTEVLVRSRAVTYNGHAGVAVMVEDNGPGIPADVLPDIFEAFVTTRLDAQGTGLGLAVTEGIVTQHGGSISASNRAQGGACIEVKLPLVK